MLEFKKVTLEDTEILTPYLRKYGAFSCQYSMYLMTGLSMKYGDEFAVSDGIIYIHRSKLVLILPLWEILTTDLKRHFPCF